MKCVGPEAKDADLWIVIWEEVHTEEKLPRLKALQKQRGATDPTAGIRCDGSHPKVLQTCQKKRREVVKFLKNVGQCGTRPQQACTTMLFLISKNVRSERRIALLPHSDVVVGVVACACGGKKGIVLCAMRLMGATKVRITFFASIVANLLLHLVLQDEHRVEEYCVLSSKAASDCDRVSVKPEPQSFTLE